MIIMRHKWRLAEVNERKDRIFSCACGASKIVTANGTFRYIGTDGAILRTANPCLLLNQSESWHYVKKSTAESHLKDALIIINLFVEGLPNALDIAKRYVKSINYEEAKKIVEI